MTAPQIGPTNPGPCQGCGRDAPRWELALVHQRSFLCAGCLRVIQMLIKTELDRPHMRGVAGDTRAPMPRRER